MCFLPSACSSAWNQAQATIPEVSRASDVSSPGDNLTAYGLFCTSDAAREVLWNATLAWCPDKCHVQSLYDGSIETHSHALATFDPRRASPSDRWNASLLLSYCDGCTRAYYEATLSCTGLEHAHMATPPADAVASWCSVPACTTALTHAANSCVYGFNVVYGFDGFAGSLSVFRERERLRFSTPAAAPLWQSAAVAALGQCSPAGPPADATMAEMLANARALRINTYRVLHTAWFGETDGVPNQEHHDSEQADCPGSGCPAQTHTAFVASLNRTLAPQYGVTLCGADINFGGQTYASEDDCEAGPYGRSTPGGTDGVDCFDVSKKPVGGDAGV